MSALRATYRLQLRAGTTLDDARRLVPYLERLGVSHLYLSPILRARSGSTHGYDVIDPTQVDPALGGEAALERLAAALRERHLGLVLDIVPNHLAADPEGPFFDDLLAQGEDSPTARWFDVDWNAARGGRLTLPVLGAPLSRCLEQGEIRLERSGECVRVRVPGASLPLAPDSLPDALRDAGAAALARYGRGAGGRRRLARLLACQPYRLAHWRQALRELDYRRFFDVNELIGVRVEDPAVFAETHAKILDLVTRDLVQALRIDHVDGLLDPRVYLKRLDTALRRRCPGRSVPLFVEKILGPDEDLPEAWPVAGTTGYEFLNALEALFLAPEGARAIERAWRRLAGGAASFAAEALRSKRLVLRDLLGADVRRLARALRDASDPDAPAAAELRAAIVETIAQLPVYRTYGDRRGLGTRDRALLRDALQAARRRRVPRRALDRLESALLGAPPRDPGRARARRALLQRFQQLAGPAAAKGVEDTALYRYVPLASRNEVGGDPGAPLEGAAEQLHVANAERSCHWPLAMLSTSTHDTKRSADVRARLDVLSERADEWLEAVARWRAWNARLRRRASGRLHPDPGTEYLLYQTLVGVWPFPDPRRPGALPRVRALALLRERVGAYMQKAQREAKLHTSWLAPNPAVEQAVARYTEAILTPATGRRFLEDLGAFVARIARPGLWNALARTLVHLTAPGTPDLYNGDELWSFRLVDPDNRAPVDFAQRRALLRQVEAGMARDTPARARFLRRLVAAPEDGRIKLHVVRCALRARARHAALFREGDYRALSARGARAGHVFAFRRRLGERIAVVVVPRATASLGIEPGAAPIGPVVWNDTFLALPAPPPGRRLRCALTDRTLPLRADRPGRMLIPVGALLAELPVALLVA